MNHRTARQILRQIPAGGIDLRQSRLQFPQAQIRLPGKAAFNPHHLEAQHQRPAQQQGQQGGKEHGGKHPVPEGTLNPFFHGAASLVSSLQRRSSSSRWPLAQVMS